MSERARPQASFFTAGRRIPHNNSYIIADQCYVQYKSHTSRQTPQHLPTLFIHGGGLTGAQWEATPDLRPGWACRANDHGYDAYLLDTVDNGRSARAPDHIRVDTNVEHRTAKDVWTNFRFGLAKDFERKQLFDDHQFPVDCFDSLLASQVSRRRTNDEAEARGIVDAIQTIGDCHVVAHSHGAALIMDALGSSMLQTTVMQHVKSMALVEPGPTGSAEDLRKEIPTLIIWGDYLDGHELWPKIAAPFENSPAEIIRLPEIGIKGNSHIPMSEKNSDEVFDVIMKWLEKS